MRPIRSITRQVLVIAAVALVLAACGSDDATTVEQVGTTTSTPTPAETTTTAGATKLEQPAIWPGSDVVFDTPEAAATDFVTKVLGVPVQLGDFQAGDSRSGEIEVLCCTEGGGTILARGVLFMRQLGPSDGWFVIGAASDGQTITAPAALTEVPLAPLAVAGTGRGFEATLVVDAFVAGNAVSLDQQIAQGGSETPEPFTATLDLSGAAPGDTIMVLVRGGTGLETDPGEFSAIAVTVAGLPATG